MIRDHGRLVYYAVILGDCCGVLSLIINVFMQPGNILLDKLGSTAKISDVGKLVVPFSLEVHFCLEKSLTSRALQHKMEFVCIFLHAH